MKNNYMFRVYYDEPDSSGYAETIEAKGVSFIDAFNKVLKDLPPQKKQYLFGMQAFVQCEPFDPDADLASI